MTTVKKVSLCNFPAAGKFAILDGEETENHKTN